MTEAPTGYVLDSAERVEHDRLATQSALRAAGLAGVTAEASLRPARVPDLAPVLLPFIERLRGPLVATGAVTDAQVQAVVDEFGDDRSTLIAYTPVLVSARGRRRT